MKQVGLITAGSQPWNSDISATCDGNFAYCSSMAIYVYKRDAFRKDYRLDGILSCHKSRIVCISWNQNRKDLLASADFKHIIVWSIASKSKIYDNLLSDSYSSIRSIFWKVCEDSCLALLCEKEGLLVWRCGTNDEIKSWKGAKSFTSDPCIARHHHYDCKVAIGHINGTISLFGNGKVHKNILAPELTNENEVCKVKELTWDNLSSEYILVLTQNNIIRLVDVSVPSVLMMFSWMGSDQLSCLTWVTSAPGMFVTTEAHSSKLTLWNVSQTSPTLTLPTKLKNLTDFHSILFVDNEDEDDKKSSLDIHPQRKKNSGNSIEFPPGKILCTFSDGGVGMYNLRKKKWSFYKEMGHVETVFDCEFHTENPNLFASGGFDGNLKIWDISDMSLVNSMNFSGIIYSVAWSPDGDKLAVATDKNGVQVWDLIRNCIEHKFYEHAGKIYRVAWNRNAPSKLASCGEDGNLVVQDIKSGKVDFHKHPTGVYGCDWNPSEVNTIATGCGDGRVRLVKVNQETIKVLPGHEIRVFQVKWSPIYSWILLSGSDDCCIKVWDTLKEECLHTLTGHSRPVRGLMWCPELPHIFFSGSWDSLILVWDLSKGRSIDAIRHHGADVYGLACHWKRPFLIASSSRDSTIRLTNVSKLVLPLQVKLLLDHPFQDVCSHSSIPMPMSSSSSSGLCGNYSMNLSKLFSTGKQTQEAFREVSSFVGGAFGHENLWNLVDVQCGKDISLLPENYKSGIVHHKHLVNSKMSEAVVFEGGGSSLVMGNSRTWPGFRSERLVRAIQMEMNLGNLEKCCEILTHLQEWDKALAIAPSVSLEYWRSLMERRCFDLKKDDVVDEEGLLYFASLGKTQDLTDHYLSFGNYLEAMVVTASNWNKMSNPWKDFKTNSQDQGDCAPAQDFNVKMRLQKIMNEMANKYFCSGSPILAACCHMAMDDVDLAMSKLIRGGEWELAIVIGNTLGSVPNHVSEAAKCLARKCEKEHLRDLAVEVVKRFVVNGKELFLGQMCCRSPFNDEAKNDFLVKADLPMSHESREKAKNMENGQNVGSDFEVVFHYLLSDHWMRGLEIGVEKVKEEMSSPTFNPARVQDLVQMMSSLHKDKLTKCPELKNKIVAMSAYIGVLLAIKRGYNAIVPYLFQCAILIASKHKLNLGINMDTVSKELDAWVLNMNSGTITEDLEKLLKKAEKMKDSYEIIEKGPDVVVSSAMPTHNTASAVSLFTKQAIQGQSYILEDGCWSISINEALMWAKVNSLSPFCSGEQINPF